jgi:tRNA(fMet)-specific endonuclease VapC
MKLMLDTNVVIAVVNGKPAAVRVKLEAALEGGAEVSISAIVLFELEYGVAKSNRPEKNAERLRAFLSGPVDVRPFEAEDATSAGEIRAALEQSGTPIGPWDVLIAGQARRSGATLITANVAEFKRVPGLDSQDWTVDA